MGLSRLAFLLLLSSTWAITNHALSWPFVVGKNCNSNKLISQFVGVFHLDQCKWASLILAWTIVQYWYVSLVWLRCIICQRRFLQWRQWRYCSRHEMNRIAALFEAPLARVAWFRHAKFALDWSVNRTGQCFMVATTLQLGNSISSISISSGCSSKGQIFACLWRWVQLDFRPERNHQRQRARLLAFGVIGGCELSFFFAFFSISSICLIGKLATNTNATKWQRTVWKFARLIQPWHSCSVVLDTKRGNFFVSS